jgi:hypothetical protein
MAKSDEAPTDKPRLFHIGAQNDALFIISGEAPALNNDYPRHDADRTCIAQVYNEAEARRIVEAANRGLEQRSAGAQRFVPQLIRQKDTGGCVVASLAMACGMTYEQVRAEIVNFDERNSANHRDTEAFLARHGFAWQQIWRYGPPENTERSPWPPEPWADVHLVNVTMPSRNSHQVVMLHDGTVLDPLCDEPKRPADYPDVNSVTAVYRLPITPLSATERRAPLGYMIASIESMKCDGMKSEFFKGRQRRPRPSAGGSARLQSPCRPKRREAVSAFNIWKENPPPRETLVMGRYALTGTGHATRWALYRTCKRGCCVFPAPNDGMGSMVLPKYWREPTANEIAAARQKGEQP